MIKDITRLKRALEGDVLDSAFDRGRYATDASIYQMMPLAVITPRSVSDIKTTIEFAQARKLSILPRGAGTSQNGQTVNKALVLDNSVYFNRLLDLDVANMRCIVEPGMVLLPYYNGQKVKGYNARIQEIRNDIHPHMQSFSFCLITPRRSALFLGLVPERDTCVRCLVLRRKSHLSNTRCKITCWDMFHELVCFVVYHGPCHISYGFIF